MRRLANSTIPTGLSMLIMLASLGTAQAMSMPDLTMKAQSDIVAVNYHDHWHDHHDHNCHAGHRYHGNDGYYEDNDDSGVLFKSFVTGTLFNRSARQAADAAEQ